MKSVCFQIRCWPVMLCIFRMPWISPSQSKTINTEWTINVGIVDNFRASTDGRYIFLDRHNQARGIEVIDASTGMSISNFLPCKFSSTFLASSDGRLLAVNCHKDGGKTTQIWDVPNSRLVRTIWHVTSDPMGPPNLSPSGNRLVTNDKSDEQDRPESKYFPSFVSSFYLWDLTNGNRLTTLVPQSIERGEDAYDCEFSPSGRYIVTAYTSGKITVWKAADGKRVADLIDLAVKGVSGRAVYAHSGRVSAFRFTLDDNSIVTGGYDMKVKVWDLQSGRLEHVLEGHKARIFKLGISIDSESLCSADRDNIIKIWSLNTGHFNTSIKAERGPNNCEFIAGDTFVFVGMQPGGAVFDVKSGAKILDLPDVGELLPPRQSVLTYDSHSKLLKIRNLPSNIH